MVLYLNNILGFGVNYSSNKQLHNFYFDINDYKLYSRDELDKIYGKDNYNKDYFIPLFSVRLAELDKEYLMNTKLKKYIELADKIDPETDGGGFVYTWFEDNDSIYWDFVLYVKKRLLEAAIQWCRENHIRYRFDPIE